MKLKNIPFLTRPKVGSLSILFAIVLLLFISISTSCDKDKNTSVSILGDWVVNLDQENNVTVQLSFYANGFFEWIPLVPNSGYDRVAAEYKLSGDKLTILNDPNCPEPGEYSVKKEGSKLMIIAENDFCPNRVEALEADWTQKNEMIDVRVQGIWSRKINLDDTLRELVFIPQQNGYFEFIISNNTTEIATSGGRYVVGESYMVIYNFIESCYGLGYYAYTVNYQNSLILNKNTEPCDIRGNVMSGTWLAE